MEVESAIVYCENDLHQHPKIKAIGTYTPLKNLMLIPLSPQVNVPKTRRTYCKGKDCKVSSFDLSLSNPSSAPFTDHPTYRNTR